MNTIRLIRTAVLFSGLKTRAANIRGDGARQGMRVVEIEQRYCAVAVGRLSQKRLPL